jgi:hypothetical protein
MIAEYYVFAANMREPRCDTLKYLDIGIINWDALLYNI